MYAAEDDGYGDEVDGEDDRNDGTNALVRDRCLMLLESAMGHWIQQRH